MQFRNITLQEQFFPILLHEPLLKSKMPHPTIHHPTFANNTIAFNENPESMYVDSFLEHIRTFWPAYIVLGLISYAMWRELSKKEVE